LKKARDKMSAITPNPTPKSIHDLYTFYLSPAHLDGKGKVTATIAEAVIKPIYNAIAKKDLYETVLHFSDRRRSLKCNKTQVESLWEIAETDDHAKWAGIKICLERIPANAGKFTIKITKPEKENQT
jgi:peptidyl-tRNA hydrolase